MQLIKALFFLLIFSFSTVQAQDTFERLYTDAEYDYIGLDVASTADGSYYIYSAVKHKDSSYYSRVNLTLLSKKGDYRDGKSWDYFVGDSLFVADSLAIFPEGSMSLMKDHIIMSFTTIEEEKSTHVFFKANLSGDVIWKQVTGGNTVAEGSSERNIIEYNNSNERLLHLGSIHDGVKAGFFINQYTDSGSQDRGNTYNFPNEDFVEQIGGIEPTLHDSAYIFCGMNDVIDSDLFVSKLDSNGLVLWAKTYALNENSSFSGNAVDIIQMNDTSYIVAYNQLDSDDQLKGYISRLDSLGDHVWTKALSYPTANCEISELLNTKNGHFAIAMKKMEADTHGIVALASFDLDANLQWVYDYKEAYNIDGIDGGMVKTSNQKIAYLMTGYDSMATTFKPLRYLIQADLTGVTRCNVAAIDLVIDSTGVFQEDFIWEIAEMDSPTDKELKEESRVALQYRVVKNDTKSCYCPMDTIDVLLDADTKGAVAFVWNDMSIFDTLRVDELGQYSVDVTIEDQYCYSLCDTVTLKDCEPPAVNIIVNADSFCIDGMVKLRAFAGAQAGIKSYSWSPGGATTSEITVPLEGIIMYTVTVIDECDQMGSASVTLNEDDYNIVIGLMLEDIGCGTVISISNEDAIDISTVEWSFNGQIIASGVDSVIVNVNGDYTVNAIDICGNAVTNDISVVFDQEELLLELSGEGCNKLIEITNSDIIDNSTIIWSFNGNPNSEFNGMVGIEVNESGNYSVTATDNCNFEISQTIEVEIIPESFELDLESELIDCKWFLSINSLDIDSIELSTIIWSFEGEEQVSGVSSIIVSQVGTYSVAAESKCGENVTASLEVTMEEQDIEIKEELSCETGTVRYSIEKDKYDSVMWSTGETTDTIFVVPGTYTLTAVICGIEKTIEFTASLDDCPDPLTFPNAFIPAEVEEEFLINKKFGPVSNIDGVSIEDIEVDDYSLVIFNRWGQMVFESSDLLNMWDGTYENENAIGGTYFFRASYTYLTREISEKGGLELIR